MTNQQCSACSGSPHILSEMHFLSRSKLMTEIFVICLLQLEKATFTMTLSGAGYTASADRHVSYLASFPGAEEWEKECLVHTVCAYA